MVVSGCPTAKEPETHASEIALLALHLSEAARGYSIPGCDESLKLRIGIHSG